MDDGTVHVAVFLIRLAFSETGGQTRFRITVYRLRTIEGDSFLPIIFPGIMYPDNLVGNIRELRRLSGHSIQAHFQRRIREEKNSENKKSSKLQSKGWISEKGYRISILLDSNIAGAFQMEQGEDREEKLLDSSRMKPSGMKLSDLGFEGRISKNRFELNLAKPESMIKWGPRIILQGNRTRNQVPSCR